MKIPCDLELAAHRPAERCRQHGAPVLLSFAVAHEDLVEREVDVLDPQPQALHQPEARAVEERGDEVGRAVQKPENCLHFRLRQDDREALGTAGAHDVAEADQRPDEDLAIEKHQSWSAWFCVEALTFPATARLERKALISASPISSGWRLP